MLRTWFDRGVDGFRVDVAYAMVKRDGLPDAPDPKENPYAWNQPGVHEIFARWRAIADSYDRDIPLIGEVWLPPEQAADYIRPGEMNQVFYFDLMLRPWSAGEFRAAIDASAAACEPCRGRRRRGLDAQQPRRAPLGQPLRPDRGGAMDTDDANARRTRPRGTVEVALGVRRARAAALLLLALPGAAYLYQGEELGLPEVLDLPDDARRDPIWFRSAGREHGRDGSRVPLPWAASAAGAGSTAGSVSTADSGSTVDSDSDSDAGTGSGGDEGADAGSKRRFSPPGSAPSWLPQPDWYADSAVDRQERDPASTLHVYRAALKLRADCSQTTSFAWAWRPAART